MYMSLNPVYDQHFHQKIVSRYQRGKRNLFKFPLLIFFRNRGHVPSLGINMDVVVRIINDHMKVFSKKNVQDRKDLVPILNLGQIIHQSGWEGLPLENSPIDMMYLLADYEKERMLNSRNEWPACIRNIHVMLNKRKLSNVVFHPETIYNVSLKGTDQHVSQYSYPKLITNQIEQFYTEPGNIRNFKKASTSTIRNVFRMAKNRTRFNDSFNPGTIYNVSLKGTDKHVLEYSIPNFITRSQQQNIPHAVNSYGIRRFSTDSENIQNFKMGSSSIIRNVQSMVDNRILFKIPFCSDVIFNVSVHDTNQPLVRNLKLLDERVNPYQYASEPPATPKRSFFDMGSVYFHDHRKIEQDIKQVKKIAIDTREAMRERSILSHHIGDMDMKNHIDVHWLSDQVYHNIEQKIRIEKERRGL